MQNVCYNWSKTHKLSKFAWYSNPVVYLHPLHLLAMPVVSELGFTIICLTSSFPSNRQHLIYDACLKVSELFCAVLCTEVVHSHSTLR